jgi:hypothetical protein
MGHNVPDFDPISQRVMRTNARQKDPEWGLSKRETGKIHQLSVVLLIPSLLYRTYEKLQFLCAIVPGLSIKISTNV